MNVKSVLDSYGLKPNTNWDQHFLQEEAILEQEVEAAEITAEDTVLQIGAGPGALTEKLLEKAQKVIAVEKDRRLAEVVRKELGDDDNLQVIADDYRQADIPEFDKCVSNIPYSLSSEITEFLGRKRKLSVISYQLEFANKITAQPGASNYSKTTVTTNYYFIPVFLREIPKASFYPRPEVDSALVKLYPRKDQFGIEDEQLFFQVTKALFLHQRKKVRNSFYDSRHLFDLGKERAKELRDQLPHCQERVVNLDLRKIADIAQAVKGRKD